MSEINEKVEENFKTVDSMLQSILSEDLVESQEAFTSILANKIAEKLEEAKIIVAQNFFESKADDLWKSAEDEHEKKNTLNKGVEKSDEVGEDEEKNNSVRQIKAIHDAHHNPLKIWDPTKHRDENEAENPEDKRVQAGAGARLAKGENTKPNELISYSHGDGSKSVVSKDDSNVLFHTLSGAAEAKARIKKDIREKLLGLIHKNPEGLKTGTDLIKKLLSSGDKKYFENSIYEDFDLKENREHQAIWASGAEMIAKHLHQKHNGADITNSDISKDYKQSNQPLANRIMFKPDYKEIHYYYKRHQKQSTQKEDFDSELMDTLDELNWLTHLNYRKKADDKLNDLVVKGGYKGEINPARELDKSVYTKARSNLSPEDQKTFDKRKAGIAKSFKIDPSVPAKEKPDQKGIFPKNKDRHSGL